MMKIGFLNAYVVDQDPNSYQREYAPMFRRFFSEQVSKEWPLSEYVVSQKQWPGSLHDCDGWIIGGSPISVYDRASWIMKLMEFVSACHQHKKPLVGICFGHQLIAQTLGGDVQKSLKGWGVGVRSFNILKAKDWMLEETKTCSLLFSHQDQVEILPQEATLLASDGFCLHQMFSMGDHIFSLQGHPEFSKEFMRNRLKERKETLGDKTYQAALESLEQPTDSHVVGSWIYRFYSRGAA